jgi:hypothetical protein
MKLILHPGHPKCGSSSIQKFLHDNRVAFEKEGYAIPDRFFHFRFEKDCDFSVAQSTVDYLKGINNHGNYQALENRIIKSTRKAQNSNIHTFILSAENLSGLHSRPLHEIFSKYFDVRKVLYYIRRQDDFLLSAWQQWGHKTGIGFTEYCRQRLKNRRSVYAGTIQLLETCYGKEALEVAPFSRQAFHNEDLISDFLLKCGLDTIVSPESIPVLENARLNPLVCDYLAQFSEIYDSAHDNLPKISLEKHKLSEPWLFNPRKDYLTEGQRRSILNHFEAENRKLHSMYFPTIPYDSLFGVKAINQEVAQEKSPRFLEDRQLEFLIQWVKKWKKLKGIRAFFIPRLRFMLKEKRRLFRSK